MKTSRFLSNGINKATLLAAALPIGLAFASPPVLAHNFTRGSGTTTNITLDDFPSWSVLRSVGVTIPDGQPNHRCAAVASADVRNPGNGDVPNQQYDFVLSLDNNNPNTNDISERTIEMLDNPGVDDPNVWPVTTNRTFTVGAGPHTIFFLGRKKEGANDTSINDSSLSVVCTHD